MLKTVTAAIVAGIAATVVAQPVSAETPTVDQLPAAIKPSGVAVYLELPATGVQIYTCGKNNTGAWAWNFKAPEAQLSDTQKKPFGKHYAGPTWEGNDGGKVVGVTKGNAPAPGGNAIAWLLLEVKSHEGNGLLTQAKEVLRVSTIGGVAPSSGCDEAHANQESRVPYTATYLFLK